MKYDVTIGMPAYQSEAYIAKSLESALAQTYPSVEILIVDDCSSDYTVDKIRDYQEHHDRGAHIRLMQHTENMGVSASRNEIIDNAQGDYLYFMDSDDLIAENTIALLMQNIRQYDAEIAFGSYVKVDLSGKEHIYRYPSLLLLEDDQLPFFAYRRYGGIQASACNYLVKTSLLRDKKCRFLPFDYWEDFVFTFNLVTHISRAVLLPDITYYYFCRENSLSHYQERGQISKDEILQNVKAIESLKASSASLIKKDYYPNRCLNVVMTDFYIACHVIRRRKEIMPRVTSQEIKSMMSHPASFRQICSFRYSRMKNLALYMLGILPSFLCVKVIWFFGKIKKLI